ncbi:putative phosphothreonine lyase domain-containing protein [Streptomyces goshikiensis]|uniref:putative phosphothreonine lyase domain-containing protein n=1 Tax=Streptomyces goshikiensis TaxID=1942 RepID=UPI0036550CEE
MAQPVLPAGVSPSVELGEPWFWIQSPDAPPFPESAPWAGKWLWFPPLSCLDQAWAMVSIGVRENRLSYRAKVGTLRNARPGSDDTRRPICIFTLDWRDTQEAERVLHALRDAGIKDSLYYKTDHDTRAGRYGSGVATYLSPAGGRRLVIPRRTRQSLEHYQAAILQARQAADTRRAEAAGVITRRIRNTGAS